MRIKCLKDVHDGTSLKKDKIYEARQSQNGMFAVIDESGDEYAYPSDIFDVINEVIVFTDIDAREIVQVIRLHRKNIALTTIAEFIGKSVELVKDILRECGCDENELVS